MAKKNKFIALFFAAAVFFAFVLSVSFVIYESEHDCIGESCQLCALIDTVNESIRNITSAVLVCALTLALIYIGCKCVFCFVDVFSKSTPVVLGVKLLN